MKNTPLDPYYGLTDSFPWPKDLYPDNSQDLQRLRQKLRQAKRLELTDRQRQVLSLYYEQGMSIPQIGNTLGVHRSTVSRTLRRARERLRHYLRYTL